jgi:hypothetical protein
MPDRGEVIEGEVLLVKRALILTIFVGAPGLYVSGEFLGMWGLSPANLALFAAGAFALANALVLFIMWRYPHLLGLMQAGADMSDEEALEAAQGMLGLGEDDG